MNPFQVEQKRVELLSALPNLYGRVKLKHLIEFYEYLFDSDNHILLEAYGSEFIDELLTELPKFNSHFQSPVETETIILLLKKLKLQPCCKNYKECIEKETERITANLNSLMNILGGDSSKQTSGITLPIIEQYKNDPDYSAGILESLSIKINRGKNENSFIIIPSQQRVSDTLEKQVKTCFNLALKYLSNHQKKFYKYHEVLIYFENRSASYEGNSLGIAFTLGIIEALTNFYNLPYLIKIKTNVTLTGGFDQDGNILPISANLIKKKMETVFYSQTEYFVIPKQDELAANEKLSELKKLYPLRNLRLIFSDTLYDLIDRRSLIEIKKQSHVLRTIKGIRRNKVTALLFLFIILMLGFVWIREFDDNPVIIEYQSNYVLLKNKSGKLLWGKSLNVDSKLMMNEGIAKQFVRLMDFNSDGINEVLICGEKLNELEKKTQFGRICCYSNTGRKIWSYRFNETVKTRTEIFKDNFILRMIDTLTEKNKNILYLFANYDLLYPSVLLRIDLQTGKKLSGELFNPGTIYSALIKEIDNDNHPEIIVGCVNNAIKLPCIFSVETEKLAGINYSTPDYQFIGKEASRLDACLFLPKTDYTIFHRGYINPFVLGSLEDRTNENKLSFTIEEGILGQKTMLVYKLRYDFKQIEIIVNSDLRVRRDSLVARGQLNMPFTDTKEYTEMLKEQILKWDGKKLSPAMRFDMTGVK